MGAAHEHTAMGAHERTAPSARDALRTALRLTALLVAAGCDLTGPTDSATPPPQVLASAVSDNPHNVLSAVVSARVRFADSVAVRYGLAGTAMDSTTAVVIPIADSAVIPAFGLLPGSGYALQLVAYQGGRTVLGDTLFYQTGALPLDLPRYVASGPDPAPGYVVFAAGRYGVVIDNTGRVVWYHRFQDGPGLNFMAQSTGRYVARPATPDASGRQLWVEIDPLGNVTRSFGCAGGLQPRFHDLIARPDGSYWILCDETRTMDLAYLGGVADAQVMGNVVQHVSATGELLFQWSPFDHFAITDLDAASRTGRNVNWTHGNALDLDAAGNLVVSFRNLGEITKIDTRTGRVVWRMGGLGNEFLFEDNAVPPFSGQHGVRVTAPGHLLLLDNLGDPSASRAKRYVYDEELRTARLLASFGPNPPVTALLGGSVQDLPGGRTLVAFGNGASVEEYDAAGRVMWRIEGNPGYVFRAQRIRSLYHPGINLSR